MKENLGCIDKIIRTVLGTVLVVWAVMGGPVWAWAGVILLATAVINFCPLYAIFGFKTCKKCKVETAKIEE